MPQPVRFVVSAGTVPEGFCPDSWQVALDTFLSLIEVTPNQQYATFVTGSQAPASNEGPWLKDGVEWWVWSDALGTYIRQPIIGGFNSLTVLDASNNYTVPNSTFRIKVEAWGAGGGGMINNGGDASGGGGGGGYGLKIFDVTPGQIIPIVVGVGGTGGAIPTDGTDTTVLTLTAGGGKKGDNTSPTQSGGDGGVTAGADIAVNGGTGMRAVNVGSGGNGGDAGGAGGSGGVINEASAAPGNGVAPGGGGVGGSSGGDDPGNGANGLVLIWT